MRKNLIIDKLNFDTSTGFNPRILYCFNFSLKGKYCNLCKSKLKCYQEYKNMVDTLLINK